VTPGVRRLAAAVAAGLVAAVATVIMVASPAAAHGQFVSSDPAANATIAEPLETLYIYFSEHPTSNAYFAVTAPSGVRVDRLWTQGPTQDISPPRHEWYHQDNGDWVVKQYTTAYSAQIPIAYWPDDGLYKVEYLSVATDGEPVRGDFTFTYSGPTSKLPADYSPQASQPDPNLLAVASANAPTAPPTGKPIEEIVAEAQKGPGLWVVWVPLGLVLAIVGAGIVYWRLRPNEARELVVSRFGGRYGAPTQRGPGVTERLQEVLPARLQELPARLRGWRGGTTEQPVVTATRTSEGDDKPAKDERAD
jgi:methionine-rich copper-binding protein CopC